MAGTSEHETQAQTEWDDGRRENQPHGNEQAEHHREKRAVSDQTSTPGQPMPTPRPRRSSQ
jgi:hypothetical protein